MGFANYSLKMVFNILKKYFNAKKKNAKEGKKHYSQICKYCMSCYCPIMKL